MFDRALPKQRAVSAIQTHEGALIFLFQWLGQKNPVTPDYGGGVASLGEFDFPGNVLGGAPLQGKIAFRGFSGARGAAPHGPVGGGQERGGKPQEKNVENFHAQRITSGTMGASVG